MPPLDKTQDASTRTRAQARRVRVPLWMDGGVRRTRPCSGTSGVSRQEVVPYSTTPAITTRKKALSDPSTFAFPTTTFCPSRMSMSVLMRPFT